MKGILLYICDFENDVLDLRPARSKSKLLTLSDVIRPVWFNSDIK